MTGITLTMKFFRLFLSLLNFIFITVGIAGIVLAIYLLHDTELQQLRPLLHPDLNLNRGFQLSNIEILAIILIIIGGIVFILGFVGCCERVRGFHCLHIFYATILTGIILTEMILVVIYFFYQSHFKSKLIDHLQNSISIYYVGKPGSTSMPMNSISLAWDFTQYYLQCCGALSPKDFSSAQNWNRIDPYGSGKTLLIPFTCCPLGPMENLYSTPKNLTATIDCATTGVKSYSIGCYDRLLILLNTYKNSFIVSVIVIVVMQIFAFLLSIYIYRRRKQYNSL